MALVLWSGGCDSTLLLYDLLTAKPAADGKRQGRYTAMADSDHVRTISLCHPQITCSPHGKRARTTLLPILRKRAKKDKEFLSLELELRQAGKLGVEPGEGLIQPAIWLLTASLYLDANEDLYAGYIKGDDIWHYRDHLVNSFQWLQNLTGKRGSLLFPLEFISKAEVIARLKQARLYKHTWYCELPEKGKVCGKCGSCRTHRTALWQLKVGLEKLAS